MQLITILGQTSSGKSEMATSLAKHLVYKNLRTCIVSCDSRQIYRGLNIGTGKVEGVWEFDYSLQSDSFKHKGITHFMIDFIDPNLDYNLQNYISDFYNLMKSIEEKFDIVILVGGTGLYAKAIVEQIDLGQIKSEFLENYISHKTKLQSKTLYQLQQICIDQKIKLNNSDFNNKIRLVSNFLKIYTRENSWIQPSQYFRFTKQCLFAINIDQTELRTKIVQRLKNRFNLGLLNEIEKFTFLGHDKFIALGLEYRLGWLFLNNQITEQEMHNRLLIENLQYAKRQMTWLKKQKNLIWIRNLAEIREQIKL